MSMLEPGKQDGMGKILYKSILELSHIKKITNKKCNKYRRNLEDIENKFYSR